MDDIIILGSKDFKDALQSTMIFKISKLSETNVSNNNYVVKFSNTIIFSNEYLQINKEIKDKKYICDYDCDIKTGSIVWNQHKDKLSNNKKNSEYITLVYPRNLVDNKIVIKPDNTKKQYIKINVEPVKSPFIVINRIIGIKDISLKPVLVEETDNGSYLFENHINVITGKIDDLKVQGCQSQVWLKAELNAEGKIQFLADSDALITKGLVSLLVLFFDNLTPEEIIKAQPKFIEEIGLRNHLSPSRANGLLSMIKQIKFYGMAYKIKAASLSK